jgi:hypothetical protein
VPIRRLIKIDYAPAAKEAETVAIDRSDLEEAVFVLA